MKKIIDIENLDLKYSNLEKLSTNNAQSQLVNCFLTFSNKIYRCQFIPLFGYVICISFSPIMILRLLVSPCESNNKAS